MVVSKYVAHLGQEYKVYYRVRENYDGSGSNTTITTLKQKERKTCKEIGGAT